MKFYKIRHKPTGLFLKKSRSYEDNLSKKGKIYEVKPSLKWFSQGEDRIFIDLNGKRTLASFKDFEIVEYNVKELIF